MPPAGNGAAELACVTLRAIARAVWLQDARLAHRLRGSPVFAEQYLRVGDDSLVYFADSAECRDLVMLANQQRFDEVAQLAAAAA
eukprot:3414290-Pyramimonas_sp.AAC.1